MPRLRSREHLVEEHALQEYPADVVVPADWPDLLTIPVATLRRRESSTPESQSGDTPEIPYVVFLDGDPVCRDSTRKEVIAAITLSEEDGRVTVFSNGAFDDCQATSLVSD